MKNLILLIILSYFSLAYSQTTTEKNELNKLKIPKENLDCSKYVKHHYDKVTGVSYDATLITLGNPKSTEYLTLDLMSLGGGGLYITFTSYGINTCIEEKEQVVLLFTDDTRVFLYNSDFNCKGYSTILMGKLYNNEEQLIQMIQKKIKTVRVYNMDSYIEENITAIQADKIRNAIVCLTK